MQVKHQTRILIAVLALCALASGIYFGSKRTEIVPAASDSVGTFTGAKIACANPQTPASCSSELLAGKLLVINFPHNPTGYLPPRTTFNEIITIARERNVTIFSDEVYRGREYAEGDRLPAAADVSEQAVSLGVMSKAFGLPGLRIGWLVAKDPAVREALLTFKDYTTIDNSAPSEFLATTALRAKEHLRVGRGLRAGSRDSAQIADVRSHVSVASATGRET